MIYSNLKKVISGKRLIFCGTGIALKHIIQDLVGVNYTIAGLLDNNHQKHGMRLYDTTITPFHSITTKKYDFIVLATPFYADMIKQLTTLGVDLSKFIRLGASYSFGCSIFETHFAQQALTNRNFTLISDNCWGGILYSWLGLQFHTPFINVIVPPKSFLALANNLDHYLGLDLLFNPQDQQTTYPVGALGDVRINFVHDTTPQEARQKWYRRLKRINPNNIFFKFETDNPNYIQAFDSLTTPKKIVFTRNQSVTGSSVILLNDQHIDGPKLQQTCMTCGKKINLVNWLNSGDTCTARTPQQTPKSQCIPPS